jgi:hypothetical protein
VVGIPLRAPADIPLPVAAEAVVDIQLPAVAEVVDIQLPVVAEAVVDIQLPAVAEVAVGSTLPEATTGLIADDKNFELLPGGPPSRPLFCLLFVSLNRRLREARQPSPAPTKVDFVALNPCRFHRWYC